MPRRRSEEPEAVSEACSEQQMQTRKLGLGGIAACHTTGPHDQYINISLTKNHKAIRTHRYYSPTRILTLPLPPWTVI